MRYVEVAGERLSVIGVGAWQFGSRDWGYGDEYASSTAIEIVHHALDLGVNLLDTAEIYGFGNSERIVGRAIEDRRDRAFVASKLLPIVPPVGPGFIESRGRKSLRRLGIDVIDLYQVHWPNPAIPKRTLADGLRRLRETGVIRHVGVSNYGRDGWEALEHELGSTILSNQVEYSLATRKPDREVVPFAQQNDRLVIAYSPLAQGLLACKYEPGNVPHDVRRNNSLFLRENVERAAPLLEALKDVAKSHDATPAQVALAWVVRHPNVVAIPGASSVEQLESNVAAADLALTDEDVARLTEASDRFEPVRGAAAVPKLLANRFKH